MTGRDAASGLPPASADLILDTVIELLEADGYEGVQLRTVAKRARLSLSTIYQRFPSRDALILAAVERWMALKVYQPLPKAAPGEALSTALNRLVNNVYEPWRLNPKMLDVFLRASRGPGGERLLPQGVEAADSYISALLAELRGQVDQEYLDDIEMILLSVVQGLLDRFARGDIDVDQIVLLVERAINRLTSGLVVAVAVPPSEEFEMD